MINPQSLRLKSKFLWAIRDWFNQNGYEEVITPIRVPSPALESNLVAIQSEDLWLHTSPEFAMKRVLSSGLHRIYQIATCFRSDEIGRHHSSEFSMLEWYRTGAGLWTFMDEVIEFINYSFSQFDHPIPKWERISTHDLLSPNLSPEDWFFQWVDTVEPNLPEAAVVYNYPIWQSALSRTNQHSSERFEIYMNGVELGNAFHEELHSDSLRKRWESANIEKINNNLPEHPIDETFLTAVAKMPRCSGIAIGLDRLLMVLTGGSCIQDYQVQHSVEK